MLVVSKMLDSMLNAHSLSWRIRQVMRASIRTHSPHLHADVVPLLLQCTSLADLTHAQR
jgi:hypothetical protein